MVNRRFPRKTKGKTMNLTFALFAVALVTGQAADTPPNYTPPMTFPFMPTHPPTGMVAVNPVNSPILPVSAESPAVPAPAADVPTPPVDPGGAFAQQPPAGPRVYGSVEYLLWWIRDDHTPPLVSTSPVGTPLPASLGPNTTVLYGGDLSNNPFSGARYTLGCWLDSCRTWAIEGNVFFLGMRSTNFFADSQEFPILGRPFFDLNNRVESAQLTTLPGIAADGTTVTSSSELWGAEANVRSNLWNWRSGRLDGLVGFRYLDLQENLAIGEDLTLLTNVVLDNGPLPAGTHVGLVDSFNTHNQFYGGQVGLAGAWFWGRWMVGTLGKVALGCNNETIQINGFQNVTPPAGPAQTFQGGLLALPSNIGTFNRDRFAVVPEVGANVGYQLNKHVRFTLGYTFLLISNVVRPGEQIDPGLNINEIPNFEKGPPPIRVGPVVPFSETAFWAQGVNLGVQFFF